MRTFAGLLLTAALVPAADPAEVKKKAGENWETAEAGPFVQHETKHLLLTAPPAMERQLKAIGVLFEKEYDLARAALGLEEKDALPGKVAVYLFASREPFAAFVRRIEKRRVMPEDVGSFSADDDDLHAAAGPPRKGGPPVEVLAGEQLAGLLLSRKAGKATPLPSWLLSGFGRATYYRAAPGTKLATDDRRSAARLARVRSAADVWNATASADEMDILAGSLVDFLAYGPAAGKFVRFVVGFQPGENMDSRTAAQAMEAAGWNPDMIDQRWKAWAAR
jgi:hypothetical protein